MSAVLSASGYHDEKVEIRELKPILGDGNYIH